MTATESRTERCRSCGHEIVRGIWFDPAGAAHPDTWTHSAGGVLCERGGFAAPRGPTAPNSEVNA